MSRTYSRNRVALVVARVQLRSMPGTEVHRSDLAPRTFHGVDEDDARYCR